MSVNQSPIGRIDTLVNDRSHSIDLVHAGSSVCLQIGATGVRFKQRRTGAKRGQSPQFLPFDEKDIRRAEALAAAFDMALILRGVRLGVVRFNDRTGELAFNGLQYSTTGAPADFSRTLDVIGRTELGAAVHKAGGGS